MTDQKQHPTIVLPRELMQQWREQVWFVKNEAEREERLMERAAEWGYEQRGEVNEAQLLQARDQELEACCEVLENDLCCFVSDDLRAARRPKPPTLAEQGMEALRSTPCTEQRHYDALFAALNRLAELEDSND